MLTSAPFDNWWHNAYGLDVKIVSPPHTLLVIGVFGVEIGSLFLIMAAMNRAESQSRLVSSAAGNVALSRRHDADSHDVLPHGVHVGHLPAPAPEPMSRSPSEFRSITPRCGRHRAIAGRQRWMTAIYTVVLDRHDSDPSAVPGGAETGAGVSAGDALYSAQVSAAADRSGGAARPAVVPHRRTEQAAGGGDQRARCLCCRWLRFRWPFANFLMTRASENRFFATGYHDYGIPSWSAEVTRHFVESRAWGGALVRAWRWPCSIPRSAPGWACCSATGCERFNDDFRLVRSIGLCAVLSKCLLEKAARRVCPLASSTMRVAVVSCVVLLVSASAHAHVGSPDVYAEGQAGPYKLSVVVRPPLVIPGVADIEVRAQTWASTALP